MFILRNKKWQFYLIVIITLIMAYFSAFGMNRFVLGTEVNIKGAPQMRFGIDIKGGIEAYFEAAEDDYTPTKEDLEDAKDVFESRLDSQNIFDREVMIDTNTGTLIVRFPFESGEDASSAGQTMETIGKTALLEFKGPDEVVILTGAEVKKAEARYLYESAQWAVSLEFNEGGTKAFADATRKFLNQSIGIYVDGQMISSPNVNDVIETGQGVISGNFTSESATALAGQIKSGALPFNMKTSSFNIISPTLGSNSLDIMVYAGFVTFIIIVIFMVLFYRLPGITACIALTLQLAAQILAISIPQFSLTLPGIAGIILSIGMGVDANVLISERIKEEIRDGKTITLSIESGFNRAFAAIIDSNATGIITAIILMWLGSGTMQSFGYTLCTGIIINLFTAITCTKTMTRALSGYYPLRKTWLFGGKREKNV